MRRGGQTDVVMWPDLDAADAHPARSTASAPSWRSLQASTIHLATLRALPVPEK